MATNEELVAKAQQLYVSYYGRPADPAGLAFWISVFENTDNVDQVLIDFGTSQEYLDWIEDNGLDTSEKLITALFQQMFNRDPDEEGLAFYVDLLESGAASLASIALDIANGAQNEDITILNNKVDVANTFTADVEAGNKAYTSANIPDAQALLAAVDGTAASVTAGKAAASALVATFPTMGTGGEFTLDEDNLVGNYSAFTGGVTVTLDGDSDEADFVVIGSDFDDVVILEEFRSADIDLRGPSASDTLDTGEHGGTATVNLLAGTFKMVDGADTFSGTIKNVENIIGSDGDDTLTGSNGPNWFWPGDGDDTVKGGLGDDYFVFEDEDQFETVAATGNIDGQTGMDTVQFTADAVDLDAIAEGHMAVEKLELTDVENEGETTLIVEVAGGGHVSIDDFATLKGSAGVDTVVVTGGTAVTLAGTAISGIEVITSAAPASDFTIDSSHAGIALVASDVGLSGILTLSTPLASGSFDLTKLSLTGFESLVGASVAGIYQTVTINQSILDQLVANGPSAGVFVGLDDFVPVGATAGSDVIVLGSNVDFTAIPAGDLDVATISYGASDTALFGDISAEPTIVSVAGSAGTADTMVITPGAGVVPMDLTAKAFSGIENIIFDILTADFGADIVTVSETTFSGIDTINGEVDFLALVSAAGKMVDLSGVEITDGFDLSSTAAVDVVKISQSGVDGFKTLGANSAFVSLAMADTSLDVSGGKMTGAGALSVAGTTGDDTVVGETVTNITTRGGTATYTLGKGNDTWSGAATTVNVGGGSNTVTGTVLAGGAVMLTDGLAATKTTDGANTFNGSSLSTVTGGAGADTLNGVFVGATNTLKAGDDTLIGVGGVSLTLGDGNDTFMTYSPSMQLAMANSAGVVGGHTSMAALPPKLGAGTETLTSSIAGDVLYGGKGADVFTITGASWSPVFVGTGTAMTNLAGIAPTITIGTGTSANAIAATMLGTGFGAGPAVSLLDFNVGPKDKLYFDLLGTYTTGTALTTGGGALSGTTTITTALAGARTENGGVRVLNAEGQLVTIAEGEAIGTTVALKNLPGTGTMGTGPGAIPTAAMTTTGPGFTNTVGFLTFLYNTNIGGTGAGGIRAGLANTTYVMFARTATTAGADIRAYLVTAAPANTGTVAPGEVALITLAAIGASDGIGGGDIILI